MTNYFQVDNISKSFGDKQLFQNITFSVFDNQRVALIAKNGTGKTTLLNIIANRESADIGTVTFKKDLRIGYLEQSPSFADELSVIDACLQSDNEVVHTIAAYEHAMLHPEEEKLAEILSKMDMLKTWDYETRIKQILGKLKINNFEQKINELSGGQLKRVALANVLISEPELLILDEPTNHLDLEMVEWLEDFLKRSTMSILMVTHDRYFLDRVCTDILEIENSTLYAYSGNYSYYLEKREERIDAFNAETESARNIYRRELEWMRSTPQARTGKSKGRIGRFHEIEERAKQRTENSNVKLAVKASYLGSKIFEAKYISKAYGDLKILDNFYYNFARYEKLGIIGKNGTGKTTFLRILLGETKPDSGSVDVGDTVRFGYYSQSGLLLDEEMKVIDVVREIAEEVDLGNGKKMNASQFLNYFLFTPEKQHNFVYKLSGGEKRRLHLCTVLMQNPNFLVLDEPTNDLDIATLNILEDYLETFKGCVIVVSHDRYFMDKVVDHLFVFEGDAVVRDFPGNYTQYREQQEQISTKESVIKKQQSNEKKKVNNTPESKTTTEMPRKMSFKEKKEFEEIEKTITELEIEKAEIESKLASGSMNDEEIIALPLRYAEINELLEEKEMRWLELSEISG